MPGSRSARPSIHWEHTVPIDPRTPVLVGCGQVTNRPPWAGADLPGAPATAVPAPPAGAAPGAAEPLDLPGAEPLDLMVHAARRAVSDCGPGGGSLLARVDSVRVVRPVSWHYANAAAPVADRLGIAPRELVHSPIGGNTPLALAAASAGAIAAGELDVVLVAGAECLGSRQRHRHATGSEPPWMVQGPDTPAPVMVGTDRRDPVSPEELAAGLALPIHVYPLFEVARRAAAGRTPEAHRQLVGSLWSRFAEVAAGNPWAWDHRRWTADEITLPGPGNRMLSTPYTKRLVANDRVDQGAAVILCSAQAARSAGIPEDRWVFPWAAAEGHDHWFLTNRWDLGRSPAVAAAGARLVADTGTGVDDVAHVDLYSCFPSAVQMGAEALGLAIEDPDRPLTVTGGLSFFGGPINDYALHGLAHMALVLRADPGSIGLVSGLGWYTTKHTLGLWSTRPPAGGFRHASVQAEVDALPSRQGAPEHVGEVTVETYTVVHDRDGGAERALAAVLTPDGRRTWATATDPATLAELLDGEASGRAAEVDAARRLRLG